MSDPQPSPPGPHLQVLILADDLTGACDTAQPFAAAMPTGVLVRGLEGLGHALGWPVLSVNGGTRSLGPQAAAAATAEILSRLGACRADVTYKKMDSTLRGNVAAELQAVADAFPGHPVLVAPALPAMGRTTVDGRVLVRGVPVDQTEYAADPRHPVREASLLNLLRGGDDGAAELIPLAQVRAGASALAAALAAPGARARFLCLDAETDSDLDAIARTVEAMASPCVLAGSAGLAAALARGRGMHGASGGAGPPPFRAAAGGTLIVIGTRNPATIRQVEWLRREGLAAVIPVHPDRCQREGRRPEVLSLATHVRAALAARKDAVLHVAGGYVKELSAARLLAELVEAIPLAEVTGLVLSGGGTAEAVLHRLGTWGVHLIDGGIPSGCSAGLLRGGAFHGVRVVLKAGGFGAERLLACLLDLPPHSPRRG